MVKRRGSRRKSMVEREPSGRPKRVVERDRGTEELQQKRQSLTGKPDTPIDIADPIDVMYRGKDQILTDSQARAAAMWRADHRAVMQGEGPKLAMLREPGSSNGPGYQRVQAAKQTLDKIDKALRFVRPAEASAARQAVLHFVFPREPKLVAHVLGRIAWALGLK